LNYKPFRIALSTAFAAAFVLVGCGTTKKKITPPTNPTVTITNPIQTIASGGSAVTVNATVTNDGTTPGVNWSLVTTGTTTACAPACGALSGATTTSVIYTSPSSPPSPATVSLVATSLSDSTVVATDNFTVTGTPANVACQANPALRGNEAQLTQPIAFLVKGFDGDGFPIDYLGSFTPDGSGAITSAALDVVSFNSGTGQLLLSLADSSYSYGADGRGCLSIAFPGAGRVTQPASPKQVHRYTGLGAATSARAPKTYTNPLKRHKNGAQQTPAVTGLVLSFAILSPKGPGRIIEFDNVDGEGTVTAGDMHVQNPDDFDADTLAANFAFGFDGWYDSGDGFPRVTAVGSFAYDDEGNLTNGYADEHLNGQTVGEQSGGSGTLEIKPASATGRGEGTYSTANNGGQNLEFNFAYYVVNSSDMLIISSDDPNQSAFMLSGRALARGSSSPALNGIYITALNGLNCSGCPDYTPQNGINYVSIATLTLDSSLTATGTLYTTSGGPTTSNPFNGTYTLDSGPGRIAFSNALAESVGYLTSGGSDDQITAFLMDGEGFGAVGFIVPQVEFSPDFSNADLNGNFTFGSAEDMAGQQGAAAGVFHFDGNGGSTATVDVSAERNGPESALPLSSTYTVNADGSGTLSLSQSDPLDFVTNGQFVFAIDTAGEPLLYVLVGPPDQRLNKKKTPTTAAHQ
jgi:hypothetical protein